VEFLAVGSPYCDSVHAKWGSNTSSLASNYDSQSTVTGTSLFLDYFDAQGVDGVGRFHPEWDDLVSCQLVGTSEKFVESGKGRGGRKRTFPPRVLKALDKHMAQRTAIG
jgi:hypothetical protein